MGLAQLLCTSEILKSYIFRRFMTFAIKTLISSGQPTQTWTVLLVKSCPQSPHLSVSMAPSMLTLLSFKQIWSRIPGFIFLWWPTPPLFPLKKLFMSNWTWQKLPMPVLNPPIKWSSVILVTVGDLEIY